MRILGHIHTLNDEDVIERAIEALARGTYPVAEILVVDNGSTDRTLDRISSRAVTILRHTNNRGTSGAVATGFQYALSKGYDWVWVLDADSVPRKDALEKLVELYSSLSAEAQSEIGILSSVMDPALRVPPIDYGLLTTTGPRPAKIDASQPYCECDCTIWSGSLFNLQVVRKVGLPRVGGGGFWDDLSLDWGDIEFTYRIKQAAHRILVHRASIMDHPIGASTQRSVFRRTVVTTNHLPVRRYLYFRNMVYFWLYVHSQRSLVRIVAHLWARILIALAKIVTMEDERLAKVGAVLRGAWDGYRKELHHRY